VSGRPSTFNEEIATDICEWIANGQSLTKYCELPETPGYRTILQWLDKDAEFARKYARAREIQAEHHNDKIIDIADDPRILADDKRVRIDARKWAAAKQWPKKYGEKRLIEGNPDAPITVEHRRVLDVSNLTVAQLEALDQALTLSLEKPVLENQAETGEVG
jgi:hypothetical protein